MVIAEAGWLHTLGQMAGTLLLIELVLVLLVVCALMIAVAIAAWWVRSRVVPVVDQYGGEAQRLLGVAQRGTERVAQGVAEFHGRREGFQATIRAFIFGRQPESDQLPAAPSTARVADREATDGLVAGVEANGHNPPAPRNVG
jgi:hypothetical protein